VAAFCVGDYGKAVAGTKEKNIWCINSPEDSSTLHSGESQIFSSSNSSTVLISSSFCNRGSSVPLTILEAINIGKNSLRARKKTVATSIKGCIHFPQFTRLPKELQLRIWEMTDEDQRIVVIHSSSEENVYSTSTPIPPALHVYSASRQVALKHYSLTFRSHNSDEPTIYFNPATDVLYFCLDYRGRDVYNRSCWERFCHDVQKEDLARIQYLAFDIDTEGCAIILQGGYLAQQKSLKTLYLVSETARLDAGGNIVFHGVGKADWWAWMRVFRRQFTSSTFPETTLNSAAREMIESGTAFWDASKGNPWSVPEGAFICPVKTVNF
jgi:hypothetical protein